ncbi:DUF5753 domain-containing protein [Streptomyces roseoverticillatus]|uniref:DUF5753 domain-containing protein n=1 Tax=Streptomyces roseoverticillatus TaxID=66429 RepID=A0ABV3INI8_9ACTN
MREAEGGAPVSGAGERFVSRAREYMALEAEAIAFHWYELSLIPGLLQTEDYARALLTSRYPPVDEEVVEERVVTRLERQAVLQKATTVFSFVIHELALRTPVGGPEAMKAQLLHLLEVGKARNVSLQVMPIGSTVGIDGSSRMRSAPMSRSNSSRRWWKSYEMRADMAQVQLQR